MKTPRPSRTLLLALLCALIAHGCLLLWRGWVARGVVPVQTVSVQLADVGKPGGQAQTPAPTAQPATPAEPVPTPQRSLATQAAPVKPRPLMVPTAKAAAAAPQDTQSMRTSNAAGVQNKEQAGTATANPVEQNTANSPSVAAAPGTGGNANEPARILSAPKPPLPDNARRRGETGTVVLRIRVNEQGVGEVAIEQSSGSPRLDESARSTVQQHWRFAPAVRDGRKVAGDIIQPVEFRLTD